MLNDDDIQRALVIAAHPDDVDFGAAGTVATWTDSGLKVAYCVVTDGDAGGFDAAVPRDRIGPIRRDEQRAAAAEVGVSDVYFLGYPDGRLAVSLELRRDIARVIREVRPQRVVCQSRSATWCGSTPAIRTTSPPARRPCARSTRTPATRLPTPTSRTWRRGPCPRSGSWAANGATATSTSRTCSTARRQRYARTPARWRASTTSTPC